MGDWKEQLKRAKRELSSPTGERAAQKASVRHPPPDSPRDPRAGRRPMAPSVEIHRADDQVAGVATEAAGATALELPRPQTLTRQSEFVAPVPWVLRGDATQSSHSASGRAVQVFVGLDFGTAYTKAAVGLLDKVSPVDWSGVRRAEFQYVLPTEYSALSSGRCYLGQHPDAGPGDVVTGLKQSFIAGTPDDAAIRRAAVFLALVLQYVRGWVFERHGSKFGTRPLRWVLNVGTPCDSFEDEPRKRAYLRLARLAWQLSLQPSSEVNFATASALPIPTDDSLPRDLAEVEAVPEFVAQLAGYAQSAQRRNGLHALVDVGGGTVDMVTFNVHHADGEDVFPFFVPKVEPLGTFGLIANRLRGRKVDQLRTARPLCELGDPQEFSMVTGLALEDVNARDLRFYGRVQQSLLSVLRTTKQRRYRLAPEWRDGIRAFLTGGGSRLSGYRQALEGFQPLKEFNLQWLDLPPLSRLDEFDADLLEYQRISVACGLAMSALTLGQVRPASQVEDDVPVATTSLPVRERSSHEDIYAR